MNTVDSQSRIPKYRQLAERFRGQMKSGVLKPGDRLPSLNEMRDAHNLSRPTVERAYSLLERDGLIQRLHGAGVFVTQPQARRQPRRRKMKGIIGLSGAGFGFSGYSSYWSNLLGGAREAAAREEMQLLLLDPASSQGWEKVDGVLICDWNDSRTPRKELPGLPVVSLMTPVAGIASAAADDYAGIQASVAHLLSLGHRKIAYLHSHTDCGITGYRMAAYCDALQSADIEPLPDWIRLLGGNYFYGAQFSNEAHTHMRYWLEDNWAKNGCTALLCHNDETAVGAIQALRESGFRVPDDVSVMGFDGTEFCDLITPRLSSITVPLREIGEAGVELLLSQMKADTVSEEHKIFPIQLHSRETTAAPRH